MPKLTMRLAEGGGHLITRRSADEVGPRNYVTKRDWRREENDEVRREGDTAFGGNYGAAWPTTLYTLTTSSLLLSGVFSPKQRILCNPDVGNADYSVSVRATGWTVGDYFVLEKTSSLAYTVTVAIEGGATLGTLTNAGDRLWVVYTETGWANVAAATLGADPTLIFTARRDDGKTALIVGTATTLFRFWVPESYPIYESGVYESGVVGNVCAGVWLTIGSGFSTQNARRWQAKNVAGYAVFNNGVELPVTYHLDDFAVVPIWELREQGVAFVGEIEEMAGILVCADVGMIHDDYLPTVMGAVGYGSFYNGQESHYDRVHYRVIWGDPQGPRRWGSSVPGAMTAGSRVLTVSYDISSIAQGDEVRVIGAGENGADLVTTLLYKSTATSWILADEAETAVTEAAVSRSDAATLIVGRYDLLDIASPILRVKKFQDRLIVAKSTGFVVGEYTGEAGLPFVFQTVQATEEEVEFLHWRNTLIDVGGQYLLYAGETDFFTFDLVTRRPRVHPALSLCRNLFFDAVAGLGQESVFAAVNGFTKEVWFVLPASGSDKALALYYGGGPERERCSTVGTAYTALGLAPVPVAGANRGTEPKFLLAGIAGGTLVEYAYDRTGPLRWLRRGSTYSSLLASGYADFGDAANEKHVSAYLVLLASQSPNTSLALGILTGRNPSEALSHLTSSPITVNSPGTRCVQYLHAMGHLFQDQITVSDATNLRLALREWKYGRTGSANFARK